MKRAANTLEEVKKILKEHKAEVSRKYRVNEIGRYLEKLLRKKVDLVRKGGIRPEIRKIILKEVVCI